MKLEPDQGAENMGTPVLHVKKTDTHKLTRDIKRKYTEGSAMMLQNSSSDAYTRNNHGGVEPHQRGAVTATATLDAITIACITA